MSQPNLDSFYTNLTLWHTKTTTGEITAKCTKEYTWYSGISTFALY